MSKSILVINTPCACADCPMRYKADEVHLGVFTYQKLFRCKMEPDELCEDDGDTVYLNDIMLDGKPDWCPLKPMPEKSNIGLSDKFQWGDWEDGYNACIDEIGGNNRREEETDI